MVYQQYIMLTFILGRYCLVSKYLMKRILQSTQFFSYKMCRLFHLQDRLKPFLDLKITQKIVLRGCTHSKILVKVFYFILECD